MQARSVLISPHISGYISEVPVDDNQSVRAGEVLARIDPHDYQNALHQARANVAAAQSSIDTLNQQIALQKLVVEQDRQLVVSDQAALVLSQQNYQRYTELAKTGAGSVTRGDDDDHRVSAAARKQRLLGAEPELLRQRRGRVAAHVSDSMSAAAPEIFERSQEFPDPEAQRRLASLVGLGRTSRTGETFSRSRCRRRSAA